MSIPGGVVADAFRYVYTRVRAQRHSVKKKEARERKGRKRRGRVSPSCSGRGHGTNAAPVSVLVSRTPHPSVPAIPRVPRHRGTPHLTARYNAIVGIVVRGGRSQFRPRPVPLPVYQPGALVKCFSSRIMTRSARLWPPLLSLPLLSLFRLVSFSSSPSHARSLSSYPCSFPFFFSSPLSLSAFLLEAGSISLSPRLDSPAPSRTRSLLLLQPVGRVPWPGRAFASSNAYQRRILDTYQAMGDCFREIGIDWCSFLNPLVNKGLLEVLRTMDTLVQREGWKLGNWRVDWQCLSTYEKF